MRIEDLDPPRERPGAADDILRTLERLGMHWDGAVMRQSTRLDAYRDALAQLGAAGLLRECRCSRAALAALPENRDRAAGEELFHPAECLPGAPVDGDCALRLRVAATRIEFLDRVQGPKVFDAGAFGDFVLRRRDGLHAYQLAVVVDDAAQCVTDVVRGADLLASTPRQILLQRHLGLPTPAYMHVPLAVDASGLKLSKSEDAPGLAVLEPARLVVAVLGFLRQDPPPVLAQGPVADAWAWAIDHWRPERCSGVLKLPAPDAVRHGQTQEDTR